MKHISTIMVVMLLLFAAGCAQQMVKVTYSSDPPGGTLYELYPSRMKKRCHLPMI